MAKPTRSRDQRQKRQFCFPLMILACAAVGVAAVASPRPAQAAASCVTGENNVTAQPVVVNVNGAPVTLCSVFMRYSNNGTGVLPDLTKDPWFTNSGGNRADVYANTLLAVVEASPETFFQLGNPYDYRANNDASPGNNDISGPYFLYSENSRLSLASYKCNNGGRNCAVTSRAKPTANVPFWYIYDPVEGDNAVPGPLALLGTGAAFGWSRRLRRRVRQAAGGRMVGAALPAGLGAR